MPNKTINMDGMKFGYLTVINRTERVSKRGRPLCTCLCDCGKFVYVERKHLVNGETKSCGCKKSMLLSEFRNKGCKKDNKRLYSIYTGMKDRCFNPNSKYWNNYGGRRIAMCEEWKNDFSSFKKWSFENGYSDELSIDRIDNNGNYSPDNCRWVDMVTQENNRRNTVYCLYNGELIPVMLLSRKLGISRNSCISNYGGYKK